MGRRGRHREAPGARAAVLAVAHAAALDAATAEVVRALRAEGIPSLLLRGPAVAAWLYEAPAEREYGDIDLLVPAECFARAERVLDALGFHESALEAAFPEDRPRHAHTWIRSGGLAIDLHRMLIGIGVPPDATWDVLAEGTGRVTVSGIEVTTASEPARLVILALHAAHHVGGGTHPVTDLRLALSRISPVRWDEALVVARRLAAVPAFAAGLRLLPEGRAMLVRLDVGRTSPESTDLAGGPAFHLAQGLAVLRSTPGPLPKVRFVGRKLVPSPERMRARSRMAQQGRAGLAAAYGLRWLSALREGARAVSGLRRSRRRSRSTP